MIEGIVQLGCTVTVSRLNLYHIPELHKWLLEFLGTDNFLTLAHDPKYYCILNIAEEAKPAITKFLLDPAHCNKFDFIVNFMNQKICEEKNWDDFVKWTDRKDKYRNLSFASTFPEYFAILQPHYEASRKKNAEFGSVV